MVSIHVDRLEYNLWRWSGENRDIDRVRREKGAREITRSAWLKRLRYMLRAEWLLGQAGHGGAIGWIQEGCVVRPFNPFGITPDLAQRGGCAQANDL